MAPLSDDLGAALRQDNIAAIRDAFRTHPELRARINERAFSFDSPAINQVQSRGMLDLLLEHGADINARSKWWAGGFGMLETVPLDVAAYAIERGATVTPHGAARLGMLERLRHLVAADPKVVHARGGDGQFPLHFASTPEVAALLLDNGANIDARDIDHESTAAQWAVRERPDVARFLVSRGATTDLLMASALGDMSRVVSHIAADPASIRMSVSEHYFPKQNPRAGGSIYIWSLGANKTAHTLAHEFGHTAVFTFLMRHTPLEMELAVACETGDEESVKALISARPTLARAMPPDDAARLVHAAQDNDLARVRLFVMAGWPIAARGSHGATALHWAAYHGNAEMVRLLLTKKPPLEVMDEEHHGTPFGWAMHGANTCESGDHTAVLEALVEAGAKRPDESN